MLFGHRTLCYCLYSRNDHSCNGFEVVIVRVISGKALTPLLTMPTAFRLCDRMCQPLGTLHKLRSSALSPVRRFNHGRSPTIYRPISPLRTVLLSRVLLKSRSGLRQSDLTINYIVRGIIQTGGLATAWALAALATSFLLPNISAYSVFDITSGAMYTHVSALFSLSHSPHLNGGDTLRPCSRRFCPASGYVSA